ncbi:MAG: hypothetical protein M0P19_05155 [Nevskia sp.]|jgi:hypothetical protein|nr:hypothetical protein [Nevskia sp.]MCK9384656.1 hypothetical protein [Nevskia sp.]
MLSLDSPRWSELRHAYGKASDIPALLRLLGTLPESKEEEEPWFSLWSALAHQGDVYSASFAAVPHVVAALATNPSQACSTYFQFPAWVEICRKQKGVAVPSDLQSAYAQALSKLPALVAAASFREWDAGFLACALSAIAAAKGYASVAEAALELTPEVATDFMEWFLER